MSILVVEDNPVSAKALEISLKKGGCDTIVARNGKEALDFLQKDANIELVITDIMMPDMDGLELIRRLRNDLGLTALPVVVTTALADMATVARAADLGCRDYIVKPIRAATLLEKVRDVVKAPKAILKNRFRVMEEIGIEAHAYTALIKDFSQQVDGVIEKLEATPDTEAGPEVLSQALALEEGAELVGAERLRHTLRWMNTAHDATKSGGREKLLEELRELRGALNVAVAK